MGTTVGPYEIVSRIGAGGMGEVFLARDPRLQRRVALKRITAAGDARAQVLREARAAARLSHPHIAAVHDVIDLDDGAFIVMEYVDGESLATRLERGPLAPDQVVTIGRQLASAVAAAHAEGVIHRDLKPSNIQLTRDGSAKVLDFGVARLSSLNTTASTASAPLTSTTTIAANPGTPPYMAPEQLVGRVADERSDVYSLGAVLYEMATGRRPYRARDPLALVEEIGAGEPPLAHSLDPRVPRWLSDVIARTLKRDPAQRTRSAAALEAALASSSSSRRLRTATATLNPARLGWRGRLIAVTLLAVVAGLIAIASRVARQERESNHVVMQRPVVLAILPVDDPRNDPRAEFLGAGIASVIAGNFGTIPGLTVLSRAATAPYQNRRTDLAGIQRDLGATVVLDLTLTAVAPQVELVARLRKPGSAAPAWQQTITGDALGVEKHLLDDLARALQRVALTRPLSATDLARIGRLPTTSSDALLAYSEARALLEPSNSGDAPRQAVQLLQKAIVQDPKFALAYAALADAYWAQYQRDKDPTLVSKATDAVDAALRIDPDQAPVYTALGTMYQQTGRYEDAVKALRRALELQPDSDESHRILARVLAARGEHAAAAVEAQRAIDLRPDWNNYFTLGYVQYLAGNYAAARDAYRRTTELNPTFGGGFQALGTMYHVLGDVQEAIGNYEHAVRLSPDVPSAHSNLGLAYYTAGRYDDALKEFKSALTLRPNSALYLRNIADAYRSLGNNAAAREAYLDAIRVANAGLKVNPRDAEALGIVAICEARLRRVADAERHASELVAIAPDSYSAWLHSAEVHAVINKPEPALQDLAAAIEHGYSKRMARVDDDLQSLRRLPAFDRLVADDTATVTRR